MASKNEYSEFTKGVIGPIPPAQGIYEMSASQMAELGYRIAFHDGRVFRYAKAGATALSPGKLVKAGTFGTGQTNKAVAAAVAVGANTLTLTTTAACTTAVDGYLQINDAAGEGIQYKVRLAAANATTTTSTDLTLYDPIATALTTSSEGSLFTNPYEQVEVCSARTDLILGVPPITVTAEYYFWLQTWGIANVWSEGTPPAGAPVFLATNSGAAGVTNILPAGYDFGQPTAGTSIPAQIIGTQMVVGVDTEYKPVYLMICP